MFKNIQLENIKFSELNNEIKNINFQSYNYNYFRSDFILNTEFFFPISTKTKLTSIELFGIFYSKKYNHFFERDYYNFIINNLESFQNFSKSFIIGSSDNYYHLLIDTLPRIFGYNLNIEKYINNVIICDSKLQNKNIIQTVLNNKKINKEVITIKNGTYRFFDSFFTIKQNLSNIIYNYRSLFNDKLQNKPYKNVYVSRSDANQRKILNENELVEVLKKFNFEIVKLSELSFFDQISLFNSAKCILSLHGAGLTNLIFSHKNTQVIEIFPDFSKPSEDWYCDFNNKHNFNSVRTHFINISKIIKLDHTIYFAARYNQKNNEKKFKMDVNEKNMVSISSTDIIINTSIIEKLLISKIKL